MTRFLKKLTNFFFLDSGNKAKDSVGTGEFFLSYSNLNHHCSSKKEKHCFIVVTRHLQQIQKVVFMYVNQLGNTRWLTSCAGF